MSDVVNGFVLPTSEDEFEFRFSPEEKRRLHSVAIVNGTPEFRFDPSPNVPALTEEDVAVAFRLALEGKRPEFFYIPIPPTHPVHGRQYKQYIPEWLEGTSIGETLSETDWAMKSITNGLRSNDSKTEFWAWKKTSQLEGLATSMEFEGDKRSGSVIMSCKSVRVRKSDSEMEFVGEPRLHINDESNAAYSRYINRVLPSVAYHDEPLFLRFGEIVKLMAAVEWLMTKGVNVSQRWLEEHCSRSGKPKVTIEQLRGEPSPSKPSGGLTPLPAAPEAGTPLQQLEAPQRKDMGNVPSRNVAMKNSEAKHRRRKCPEGMAEKACLLYGYCDPGSGEMVQYDADGTLCARMRSWKVFCESRTSVDGKVAESTQFRMKIPFLEGPNGNAAPGSALPDAQDQVSSAITSSEFTEQSGYTTSLQSARTHDEGVTVTVVSESNSDSQPHTKTVCVARGSWNDYDLLYKGLDPNLPLRPDIPGVCEAITPNVQSWNEFIHSKTVPWPLVAHVPLNGECAGVLTAMGGVTARSIPVVEERRREREESARIPQDRVTVSGVPTTRYRGSISESGAVWQQQVVQHFQSAWIKSTPPCPTVRAVFAVTNRTLQSQCDAYKSTLNGSDQGVEKHFHGTTLACDILSTGRLCGNSQCGICGISDNGLDSKFIKTNIKYQRFGNGFYLAPHSSKCHDYAHTTNGYRAMLLCDVLPGKKFTARTSVNGPPAGYDSVEGVVDGSTELNYPEILLTRADAIMPRFIIVY